MNWNSYARTYFEVINDSPIKCRKNRQYDGIEFLRRIWLTLGIFIKGTRGVGTCSVKFLYEIISHKKILE